MEFARPVRRALIGGNWKCNGKTSQVKSILGHLNEMGDIPSDAEVVIAVPSIHLAQSLQVARPEISISSQDVCIHGGLGAYTGEVSAELLLDLGVKWTLVGHSERRVGFGYPGEPSAVVAMKTKTALAAGMNVILCIGEQLSDREAGKTMEVCSEQLDAVKNVLSAEDWKNVVIAYEPVWAIGTGKVATPTQAEETHRDIRQWMAENVSSEVAGDIRIIYGGSVKGSNCKSLISEPNIDGFLVGGASLLPEFVDIIKSAEGFSGKTC